MESNAEGIAATKIQAQFRGYKARKSIHEKEESAVKIQSLYRGHLTRKSLCESNNNSPNKVKTEEESAIVIQSHFRGYLARKSLQIINQNDNQKEGLLHTLSTTNPKYYYTPQQREEFKESEIDENNEKIKLKKQEKEQLKKMEESAIMIQKTFRGHQTRKSLSESKDDKNNKKQENGTKIYRRICKLRAKEIKSLRVDGYSNERQIEIHELVKQYKDNKNGQQPRWYTSDEISTHNYRNDCWVVIFRKIFNLTQLIKENSSNKNTALLIKPLLRFAGQDISDWFDSYTNDVKTYIHPTSNLKCYYLPFGRFIDVAPQNIPVTNWSFDVFHDDMPWWQNWKFVCGIKSEKPRNIRIVNTLTNQDKVVQVATEETLNEIQRFRYLAVNKHSNSYTWKYQSFVLDMNKTLKDNGIKDEDQLFDELGITEEYIPSIYIYFNDDLTVD